ncbi:MAG TPA: hypothetical protein VES02_17775 [Dermatophilaceae bacterium]|nr:hypothetical protein [Dermatophilaceae bacterium]
MKKLMSLAAFGLGYVLGARAGRERYDQLMRAFTRVREDPRVQEQAHHVAEVAKEQVPVVVDKVGDVASSAARKVRPSSSDSPDPDEVPVFMESAARPEGPFPPSVP